MNPYKKQFIKFSLIDFNLHLFNNNRLNQKIIILQYKRHSVTFRKTNENRSWIIPLVKVWK